MKLKLIALILLLALGLCRVDSYAQANVEQITPSHLAAAKQLILTTGMTDSRFSVMRSSTIQALSSSIPDKNKQKYLTELTAFFDKYLPSNTFTDRFVNIYAENFTEDELNQLIKFYKSPLGKKIVFKLPEIMQKGMLMDQQVIQEHSTELQSIITESLKE